MDGWRREMSDRANITITSVAKQADSRPGSQVIGNVLSIIIVLALSFTHTKCQIDN